MRVWNRALKHLDRIGANNHKLYPIIRAALDAEHALRVLSLYERIDSEKRAENGKPGRPPERQSQ